MRFHTKLCLNGIAVSRGYGPNKVEAKKAAARIFIELLYPKLFREWVKDESLDFDPIDKTPINLRVQKPDVEDPEAIP